MFVLITYDVNTEDADACAEFGIRVHTRSGAVPQVKS